MTDNKCISACFSNLKRLREKKVSVTIRSNAHLRELAHTFPLLPKDIFSEEAQEYRQEYEALCLSGELTDIDRAELCRHLAKEKGTPSLYTSLLDCKTPKKSCNIVYVKNALTDIACEKFSRFFDKVAVSYARDFTSALEDAYYSNADYVILPVSSEKSGRIRTFDEMIRKYELKKVLSVSVYSNTDDTENSFALLSKNNELLSVKGSDDLYFEFTLNSPQNNLTKIVTAAERFGCLCSEIETNTEREKATVVLDVSKAELDALCTYLMLEIPSHIPLGIYTII